MKPLSTPPRPCENYDPCQTPEEKHTMYFVCGWKRKEHKPGGKGRR